MADMKFVVRRNGSLVQRWDYATNAWVDWKPGETFTAKAMGMRGSYKLLLKAHKLTLKRISEKGTEMWSEKLPEGLAAYTSMHGGGFIKALPWEEPNLLMRVALLAGFEAKQVEIRPANSIALTVPTLGPAQRVDGRHYVRSLRTDGRMRMTEDGLIVDLPSYVVLLEEIPSRHANMAPQLRGTALYVWPKKFNGPGISPQTLANMLVKLQLANRMQPWEMNLWQEWRAK